MAENRKINVNWVTDRIDDDILYTLRDIRNDMVSSTFSIFGYEELDNKLRSPDKISFENSIIKTRLGNKSGFSVGATIVALANHFGPFIIPPDIIEYIQSEISDKKTYDRYMNNMPKTEEQLIKGKILVESFLNAGYPTQSAYALVGSAWTECHWDPNVFNALEKNGNGTNNTGNWSGCGEGLFGLTFWNQKKRIIERMNLHNIQHKMYKWNGSSVNKNEIFSGLISNDQSVYNKGPWPNKKNDRKSGCLFQLVEDEWINIMKLYIQDLGIASGDSKSAYDYLMWDERPKGSTDKNDDDHKLLYTSYLYKAASGTMKDWDAMMKVIEKYKDTHKKQNGRADFIPINGFVEQLLAAYILAQYCTDVKPDDISVSDILGEEYGQATGFIAKAAGFITRLVYGSARYDDYDAGLYDKEDTNNYEVDGTWWDCVCKMGKWYETNVHTYQGTRQKPRAGRKKYMCPLINGNVEDDCSAFVKACVYFFGIHEIGSVHVATALMQPGSKFDNILRANGFKCIPYSKDILQPGDIICGGPATHTEIYAGNNKSYSWGNVHDGTGNFQGMPCGFCRSIDYKHIWRYTG